MLKQNEAIATRNAVNGSYEVSAIVAGYRVSKVYYGYTKKEAIKLFVNEVNRVTTQAN